MAVSSIRAGFDFTWQLEGRAGRFKKEDGDNGKQGQKVQ